MPVSQALISLWKAEETQPFRGWDFSYLDGRMLEGQPPWSYTSWARELMRAADSVLDISTGGGERLLAMRADWPPKVVATEGYPPNFRLARERLEPLGVTVLEAEGDEVTPFSFGDEAFELVLNRHAALHVDEIARILQPGGRLLTQQVHGLWAQDLLAAFDATPQWPDATPEKYLPWLAAAGMEVVDVQNWAGELAFTDVGGLVYYLRAVPWLVPGFGVDSHLAHLARLQARLEREGRLVFEARKYLIEAQKPG